MKETKAIMKIKAPIKLEGSRNQGLRSKQSCGSNKDNLSRDQGSKETLVHVLVDSFFSKTLLINCRTDYN